MKIVIKEPMKPAYVAEIEQSLKAMQRVVGGHIETFDLDNGLILVCNERGKIEKLPRNLVMFDDVIRGTVFFCAADGDEMVGLDDETAKAVAGYYFKDGCIMCI